MSRPLNSISSLLACLLLPAVASSVQIYILQAKNSLDKWTFEQIIGLHVATAVGGDMHLYSGLFSRSQSFPLARLSVSGFGLPQEFASYFQHQRSPRWEVMESVAGKRSWNTPGACRELLAQSIDDPFLPAWVR